MQKNLAAFQAVAGAVQENTQSLGKASAADVTLGLYYLYQQRAAEKTCGDGIKELFKSFDEDKSSTMSREKLQVVLKTLDESFSQEELDLVFDSVESNSNGGIRYEEFLDLILSVGVCEAKGQVPVSDDEVNELFDRVALATIAYTGLTSGLSEEGEASVEDFEEKIREALKGIGGTLVYAYVKGEFQHPVHFVATIGNRVILSVPGTASLNDVMTDLECAQAQLPSGVGPPLLAHAGFSESSKWIIGEAFDQVVEALSKIGDKAELEVIGHSLGAGVASITFLHLRQKLAEADKLPALARCFAFAAPPCVSAELAVDSAKIGITSVVLHDDIIPRLSQHNVERLRAEILCDTDWRNVFKADFENSSLGQVAKDLGVKYDAFQSTMTAATESYKNVAKEKVLAFTGKDDYEVGDISKTAVNKASDYIAKQAEKARSSLVPSFLKSPRPEPEKDEKEQAKDAAE